jgi:transcription initiation factor TFIID subunit TAF12
MSDMLEKLLGVEKRAAGLVSEAEDEASRRTARARVESQRRHSETLKKKAIDVEKDVQAEKERLAAERADKTRAYTAALAGLSADTASFKRAALSFMGKGRP